MERIQKLTLLALTRRLIPRFLSASTFCEEGKFSARKPGR